MEISQLQYFIAVATGESMQKASEQLNISQSTLSLSIKTLEDELGLPLFDKQGRRKVLNENGKRILAIAERVSAGLNELEQCAHTLKNRLNNTVRLGFETTYLAFSSLAVFSELRPDVRISQIRGNKSELLTALHMGQIDLLISLVDNTSSTVRSIRVISDKMKLLVSQKSHLAGRTSITMQELENEVFVSVRQEYSHHDVYAGYLNAAKVTPREILMVDAPEAMMFSVQNNFGVTLISESTDNIPVHHGELNRLAVTPAGTVAIPLSDSFCMRYVYISILRHQHLSAAAKAYIDFLMCFGRMTELIARYPSVDEYRRLEASVKDTQKAGSYDN